MTTCPTANTRMVRVLPDLTGLDKQFDYLVPDSLAADVTSGRSCGCRSTGGAYAAGSRRSTRRWRSTRPGSSRSPSSRRAGPSAELIELAELGIGAMGRRPAPAVPRRGEPTDQRHEPAVVRPRTRRGARRRPSVAERLNCSPKVGESWCSRRRRHPSMAIVAAALHGPAFVVMPTVARAEAMGAALGRRGLRVAVVPRQWALAAAGADVVIGARGAAWAPCPQLGVAIVVDEHDEALQEERNPTWHARDVVIERARRAGAPVLLTTPCPTVTGVTAVGGPLVRLPVDEERAGWPIVDIVDRSDEEPWRTSLLSSALIRQLRRDVRVVCVHNTTGRARILACRTCRALVRCTRCDAAVGLSDDGQLVCPRCGADRPGVCQVCGGSGFANLRPGVTRLREELEAAAGRPVVAVTGSDRSRPEPAGVYVGTEAVLHRVDRADVVAFLDFDRELLAPRYRAGEQAMALLTKAARLARPAPARRTIDDPDVHAAARGDPGGAARRSGQAPRLRAAAAGSARSTPGQGARPRQRSGQRCCRRGAARCPRS